MSEDELWATLCGLEIYDPINKTWKTIIKDLCYAIPDNLVRVGDYPLGEPLYAKFHIYNPFSNKRKFIFYIVYYIPENNATYSRQWEQELPPGISIVQYPQGALDPPTSTYLGKLAIYLYIKELTPYGEGTHDRIGIQFNMIPNPNAYIEVTNVDIPNEVPYNSANIPVKITLTNKFNCYTWAYIEITNTTFNYKVTDYVRLSPNSTRTYTYYVFKYPYGSTKNNICVKIQNYTPTN